MARSEWKEEAKPPTILAIGAGQKKSGADCLGLRGVARQLKSESCLYEKRC
ncbi:hypothetical protein QUF88_25370 [Bacillus sp. DX1.1]|uniref:hypothetical protein n=1 Tax=unclassified Bacillus (in: firmicutes) TaxID=185979 RepID=UPI00257042C3|nr:MULTISPECIES: hypothetical protein [unclassified Bacillus (in: firmicutes)]MDM5157016.1 hypothetical protein [Bacillus sp. DX1.1]WJE81254.1 hypothetical protein QRE67_22910 [Bacillus sp. DX3.1]